MKYTDDEAEQNMCNEDKYTFENITFDSKKNEIANITSGKSIILSHTESKILEVFLSSEVGHIFSKNDLLAAAWSGRVVANASVSKNISNLRISLKECGVLNDIIVTVPRVGYKFLGAVERSPSQGDVGGDEISHLLALDERDSNAKKVGSDFISLDKIQKTLNKKLVDMMLICFGTFLLLSASLNFYSVDDINKNGFYIERGFVRERLNGIEVIHKKGEGVPIVIAKLIHRLKAGDIIFYNKRDRYVDISVYKKCCKNHSVNYSFNSGFYDDGFIYSIVEKRI